MFKKTLPLSPFSVPLLALLSLLTFSSMVSSTSA